MNDPGFRVGTAILWFKIRFEEKLNTAHNNRAKRA